MSARNLVLLTTLYAMQGIPMGLAMGSMPLILQSKGISLADQVYIRNSWGTTAVDPLSRAALLISDRLPHFLNTTGNICDC